MIYTCKYASPLGAITLAGDGDALTGLWFDGQRYFGSTLPADAKEGRSPVFDEARRWLDVYFSGQQPDFIPPLRYGSTPFRRIVYGIMLSIPYGQTMTYGEIARHAAAELGRGSMSAQAVGGAVGHVMYLRPDEHGYAGGIDRKVRLLELEGTDMSGLFVPAKGTAL